MDLYSEWPFFVALLLLFGVAASSLFRFADKPPTDRPGRVTALDGLRAVLALAVYFHHAMVVHVFSITGAWDVPPSRFYTLLGQCGVSVFFMITGYLFWSRLVRENGRPRWADLYIGRIFRIAPLYLFAVAIMFVIVAVWSRFTVAVPTSVLAIQLARWLCLGLFKGDLNEVPADTILAGVTWSLRYEWLFYLAMPLLALVARYRRLQLPFTVVGLGGSLALLAAAGLPLAAYAALFLTGMMCSSAGKLSLAGAGRNHIASVIVVTLLLIVFTATSTSYSVLAIACLGAVFYLVTAGCTVFGLLTTTPARRLGDISYGIYLLQGLVLTLVVVPLAKVTGALADPALYWVVVVVGAVVLLIVAMLTHVGIERPGIKLGRVVAAKLRALGIMGERTAPIIQQAAQAAVAAPVSHHLAQR